MKPFYILIFSLLLCFCNGTKAQQTDFNIQAAEGITVTPMGSGVLDFGTVIRGKSYEIPGNSTGQIQVVAVEAEFHREIIAFVNPPSRLRGQNLSGALSFFLTARYSTDGLVSWSQARPFKIRDISYGWPLIEIICIPNPGGNCNPNKNRNRKKKPKNTKRGKKNTIYLYFGGGIDVGQVPAGLYSGTINIIIGYNPI